MKCPKCTSDMTAMAYRSVAIDRCNECHGIWLDKRELEAVMEKKLVSSFDVGRYNHLPPEQNDKPAHCPRCDKEMIALVGAADVRFEWCDGCEGMFFDRGELSAIDEFQPE